MLRQVPSDQPMVTRPNSRNVREADWTEFLRHLRELRPDQVFDLGAGRLGRCVPLPECRPPGVVEIEHEERGPGERFAGVGIVSGCSGVPPGRGPERGRASAFAVPG